MIIATIPADFWKALGLVMVCWAIMAFGEGRHG